MSAIGTYTGGARAETLIHNGVVTHSAASATQERTLLKARYRQLRERIDVLNERLNPIKHVAQIAFYTLASVQIGQELIERVQVLQRMITQEDDPEVLICWVPLVTEAVQAQARLVQFIAARSATLLTVERMPIGDRAKALDDINGSAARLLATICDLTKKLDQMRLTIVTSRNRVSAFPTGDESGNKLNFQVSVDAF